MKLKCLFLVLVLGSVAIAQTPVAPTPIGCAVPSSPDDSMACILLQINLMNQQMLYSNALRFAALDKKVSDAQVVANVIGANQVAQQSQIESLNVSVKTLLSDDAKAQQALAQLLALFPSLSKGPLISDAPAVLSTGAATVSWTNYAQGQAVIAFGLVPQGPQGAVALSGAGPSFTFTITKPSGTTLYYWVKLNSPEGWTFTSKAYTVKLP